MACQLQPTLFLLVYVGVCTLDADGLTPTPAEVNASRILLVVETDFRTRKRAVLGSSHWFGTHDSLPGSDLVTHCLVIYFTNY